VTNRVGRQIVFATALTAMLAGGRLLPLNANVPQVPSGTWMVAGDRGEIPKDAAAAALSDGRVVVAGGRDSEGRLISQIGVYDPATGTWADGGQLVEARAGHTATALGDGRVLITGGTASYGVTFGVEIYDPTTSRSTYAGDMYVPRVNHAAAELKGGLILIVGGSDGTSPLLIAEVFDPATGRSENIATTLSGPRMRATATTLLDGHVLIAGGNNGQQDLKTAELYDVAAQTFFDTGSMKAARSGHVAILLPNNNQVLIAGGTIAGQPTASAELYSDWTDGFSDAPTPMAAARNGAVGGGLLPYDLGFIVGGGAQQAEYYRYATVKTDRADYLPGQIVTISGSGWQPGENVALTISEDADTHHDFRYTAVADGNGNILNQEFYPRHDDVYQHIGMRFYVTATGAASQALNTFTDGNADITGTVIDVVTGDPISGATVSCVAGCSVDKIRTNPTDASGRYDVQVTFSGNNNISYTVQVSKSGYAPGSSSGTVSNKDAKVHNFALSPSIASTSLAVAAASGTYAGTTTLSATLTAGGTPVSGKSVAFVLDGASVGSATTDSAGLATLTSVSLASINAGKA